MQRFKGVSNIGDSLLTEQLEVNLTEFLNWGFLHVGGFTNIVVPTSGCWGGDYHRLRPVHSPYYSDGQVWEGFRQNWVWESGAVHNSDYPIRVSGVFVDGSFQPSSGIGTYAHHVNYPLGRIVFDSPISTTSTVTTEYTYRYVHVYRHNEPWFKEIMYRSFRADDLHFLQSGSGIWSVPAGNRLQLPAVVIEVVPTTSFTGLQLGGGQIVFKDILFHVLAETAYDRNNITDIISYQNNKVIMTFDLNRMFSEDKFPLDHNGSIRDGALSYEQLIQASGNGGYFWKKARFTEMHPQEVEANQPLFRSVVRTTMEMDFREI